MGAKKRGRIARNTRKRIKRFAEKLAEAGRLAEETAKAMRKMANCASTRFSAEEVANGMRGFAREWRN